MDEEIPIRPPTGDDGGPGTVNRAFFSETIVLIAM